MKRLLFILLAALFASQVNAQTVQTYYTIASVAALKALTGRPAVVEVVGNGIFNWSTTPCSAADDVFQVTPTSGPTGCYTRMGRLTTSGAFNTTLTVTADTNVTLPTTGTLAILGANTFTGLQSFLNIAVTPVTATISGSAVTFNLALGTMFKVTNNSDATVTISNPPAAKGTGFTIVATADGTLRTWTWPASVKWVGGVAPTFSTTSGLKDKIYLETDDGGTTYLGSIIGIGYVP